MRPPQIATDPKDVDASLLKQHDPRVGLYASGTDIHTKEKMSAYLVDGKWIRDNIWTDWTAGGNHSRYFFVPDGEFWLDIADVNEADVDLIHETTEYLAMRVEGLNYDKGHARANEAEFEVRQYPERSVEMLRSLGWRV